VTRSTKAHILLLVVTFIWGATFVVIKNALSEISPLLFNAVRMTLAAFCLAAFYWRDITGMDRKTLRAGIIVGTFLWLGYEFQTSGLRLTTPSKSGFLTGVSVVLVPVLLAMFWRRKINRGAATLADWSSVNFGDLLTLGCAVAFAFQIILLGRATEHYPFRSIAFLQTATAAVLMAITVPVIEHANSTWSWRVWAAIAVTGVFGTALAFTIQAWAQQFTPATHTALIFALEPVFAWLTSYVVEGEKLGWRASAGALLILGGVVLSELKGGAGPLAEPV
jgi:drug/metabolite transporter (DMT)-like permease